MTILSNFVPQGYDLPIAIAAPECDENDVLGRYAKAAQVVGADIIIRITADCPLLNPHLCGEMLSYFKRNDLEFLSNAHPIRHVPHGWDCEIFTARLLALANSTATDPEDREHVTMALKKWADAGSITQHKWVCNEDWSDKRWTLDTLADYRRIVDLMRNDAGSTQVAA
jgi:spore coat polysaccharide biosynthesis protein SpsF (cytidylyltransferase family)